MTALIISDSHGRDQYFEMLLPLVKPDIMLHLGDYEGMDDYLMAALDCPCEFVSGNCDYDDTYPLSQVVELGRHRVFMTHGHRYGVGFGLDNLAEAAREEGCDIALYGHTHVPVLTEVNGVVIANPGSISLPRQEGRIPSYIIADIDEAGDVHFAINYLDSGKENKKKRGWFW